jgi:ABC-2 type transport system permease protein
LDTFIDCTMRSLFLKEISGFFSSFSGYVVVVAFLCANSVFLWWFHSKINILDSGYASLESLFFIAPWVFLFLIPAITMKSISEEKKTGNMDLLLTRPLSEMQIILAKYLACVSLAVISLLPTLIFYFSVIQLGNPFGNIDIGGTWGSYIGLLFLAAIYTSIGIFSSSLSENTIIAFITAVLLCFFFYLGFNSLADLTHTGQTGNLLLNMGIDAHYKSISRGVIDSRDLIYFLSVIILFLYLTLLKLRSRNW